MLYARAFLDMLRNTFGAEPVWIKECVKFVIHFVKGTDHAAGHSARGHVLRGAIPAQANFCRACIEQVPLDAIDERLSIWEAIVRGRRNDAGRRCRADTWNIRRLRSCAC